LIIWPKKPTSKTCQETYCKPNWLIHAKNWLYLPIDISGRLVEKKLKKNVFWARVTK
jgi:hypothetical protein